MSHLLMGGATTDMYAFRDYQTRSTITAERERAVEARRLAVQELRMTVRQLQTENQQRKERLQPECTAYSAKKTVQDEKLRAREAQVRAQEDRCRHARGEAERLEEALVNTEKEIERQTKELEYRQTVLAPKVESTKQKLQTLKHQLEEKDAELWRLESRVQKEGQRTIQRHALVETKLQHHQMGGWTDRVFEELVYGSPFTRSPNDADEEAEGSPHHDEAGRRASEVEEDAAVDAPRPPHRFEAEQAPGEEEVPQPSRHRGGSRQRTTSRSRPASRNPNTAVPWQLSCAEESFLSDTAGAATAGGASPLPPRSSSSFSEAAGRRSGEERRSASRGPSWHNDLAEMGGESVLLVGED